MKQYFTEEYKHPAFFEDKVQLVYISKVGECDCIYPRMMHSHHDLVEIMLITGGRGSFFIDGVYYEVKCGDIVIFNSGVIHDELTSKENKVSLYCCAVKNLAIAGLRVNALIPDDCCPVIASLEHFPQLMKLYDSMFSLLEGQVTHASFISQQLLIGLLSFLEGNLLKPHVVQKHHIQAVPLRIKEYIDNNYSENIQLQSVANHLNISLYYMAHIFKEKFGFSPGNYLVRRRIGEAQTLLLTSDYPVIKISLLVGYSNVSHFNTIFKKLTGMTPKEYRKNYLNRENHRQ